jgi:hypothetical protein
MQDPQELDPELDGWVKDTSKIIITGPESIKILGFFLNIIFKCCKNSQQRKLSKYQFIKILSVTLI